MNAATPASRQGRLRVTTADFVLPVEVRDRRMRLVGHGASPLELDLAPGTYMASVKLPVGDKLVEAVEVASAREREVDLRPEPAGLTPRARYGPRWTSSRDRIAAPPEVTLWPPGWSVQFLRMPDLAGAVHDSTPKVRAPLQHRGTLSTVVRAPRAAVYFLQIARGDEVPLNVALPIGEDHACEVAIEQRAGLLYVAALPSGERVSRVAQYLAAGEAQQAVLLTSPADAEELLRSKVADPVGAAVGAYVLLRLGELQRTHDWTTNLATWFSWLPDGAVIAGEKAAILGRHQEALHHFLKVQERGLPVFTAGFSTLVSRLRQYQSNAVIRSHFSLEETQAAQQLSARLEEWSPFVDFGALTFTFRAAALAAPVSSQHPLRARLDVVPGGRAAEVSTVGPPTVITLDFPRVLAAAARDAGRLEAVQEVKTLSDGITVHCDGSAGVDEIEVRVETNRLEWRATLLPVQVVNEDEATEYLLALGATDDGAEGRIIAPAHVDVPRLVFSLPPRPPSSLTAADAAAVRRSIGGASPVGLNLWRDIARRLPEEDPVRAAVVAGLS